MSKVSENPMPKIPAFMLRTNADAPAAEAAAATADDERRERERARHARPEEWDAYAPSRRPAMRVFANGYPAAWTPKKVYQTATLDVCYPSPRCRFVYIREVKAFVPAKPAARGKPARHGWRKVARSEFESVRARLQPDGRLKVLYKRRGWSPSA